MKKEMKTKRIIIIVAFFLGLMGIIFLLYDFMISKVNLAYETINLELYGNNVPEQVDADDVEKEPSNDSPAENKTPSKEVYKPNYIGYFEIPKINLNQGFVSMNSSDNTVEKNIQVIKPSNYPDVENGNFIVASHSGSSSISYFKNLYKLSINDIVYIRYNGYKYKYKIVDIYTVLKNGEVEIRRDLYKTTLTMITCTKNDNSSQTVYIAQLESRDVL